MELVTQENPGSLLLDGPEILFEDQVVLVDKSPWKGLDKVSAIGDISDSATARSIFIDL